jgi:hypothetical protein
MAQELKYTGMFEVGGTEAVHDCTQPKADPPRGPVDLDGGDEWQLNSGQREEVFLARKDRDTTAADDALRKRIRESSRNGGEGHNVG